MKNSLGAVALILMFAVLGCVLPNQQPEKEQAPQTPVVQKDSSEETEALKEKIAELEKKKLEEKIEDLEQKIDEQGKTTTAPAAKTTTSKAVPKGFGRVNSPGDGFLALRSEPSADRGYRITTIPHGKTLRVYSCGARTIVNGRSGRWCEVIWREDVGWVFDAYLIR